jgi:hypothetical protein
MNPWLTRYVKKYYVLAQSLLNLQLEMVGIMKLCNEFGASTLWIKKWLFTLVPFAYAGKFL